MARVTNPLGIAAQAARRVPARCSRPAPALLRRCSRHPPRARSIGEFAVADGSIVGAWTREASEKSLGPTLTRWCTGELASGWAGSGLAGAVPAGDRAVGGAQLGR